LMTHGRIYPSREVTDLRLSPRRGTPPRATRTLSKMFDGCVGKESRNARRRRCSTHTHTRRRRRRDREGLGGGRLKSPHKRRFPSASLPKERGTTSRRLGSAPSNRILECFSVLVVLPVVESMSGRRTSRVIEVAADGRARREVQPSTHRLKPGDATRRYESATARATRPHTHTKKRCINTIERTYVKIHFT